jgi:3-isopropylmalate/(R)-2-methylmalate dehydratase large subunit
MAGMTITEKILAAHAGKPRVAPGEFIMAKVDIALANDITAPIAINEFRKLDAPEVFDKTRIALVPDHSTPNKDIKAAEQCKLMREFAREHGVTHYWEVGRVGIEHALLPDEGVVAPGDLVIGADSHTCTYGAIGAFSTGMGSTDLGCAFASGETWLMVPKAIRFILEGERKPYVTGKDIILYIIGKLGVDGALYSTMEYAGEAVADLTMADRFTIANMAIEAGAKNGIFPPDDVTKRYCEGRTERPPVYLASDADAVYAETHTIDLSKLDLQVSFPHLPENAKPIGEARGIAIQQSVIGSCTNGRIEDLRAAAGILRGRTVHPEVRLIVFPATQAIYKQAMHEGLVDIFIDAGGAVSTPTCGPCLGGHMGVLAEGERAVATTNRNFVGRMGAKGSEVYLAGPAVAAASAIKGELCGPDDLD